MQALVVERHKQIEIADFEIRRRELELDYKIRKPAEAEKFRLERIAEAEKKRIVMEAEAEAEAIALKGSVFAAFRFRQLEGKLSQRWKARSFRCLGEKACEYPNELAFHLGLLASIYVRRLLGRLSSLETQLS